MARFVVVPQWQGSSSSRAMAHIDGAEAIAGDLPSSACTRVDIPLEAGEALDTGVHRASTLIRIRSAVSEALANAEGPAIVIGGDSGVAVPAIAHVAGDDVAVVWLDAHAALHTPADSPTGAYFGMALRAVLGECDPRLALPDGAVTADRVVLAGVRSCTSAEQQAITELGLGTVSVDALREPENLTDAVARTGARRVYVHVDVDVIDPFHMRGTDFPEPFGPSPESVVAAIRALRERFELAGASLAGFSPSTPSAAVDDMGAILRMIGALA